MSLTYRLLAHCRPGRGCRLIGPNSSTQKTAAGFVVFGVISRSAIAYRCSMRAFFAAYRGSLDAFQVFSR
jgi:hypothetical protein